MTSFLSRRTRRTWLAAAVVLVAACGDGRAAPADDAALPPTTAVLPAAEAAAAEGPAEPAPDVPPLPSPPAAPEPTRADSIAAAREDVSPEWKQRERQMGGFADCMRQTEGLDEASAARLQAICNRRPDAPR